MSIAPAPRLHAAPIAQDAVREQVRALLRGGAVEAHLLDRRQDRRYPFPVLMTLHSVDADASYAPQVIVGRDICERGLGFFHPAPIPFRVGIVVCDLTDGRQVAFEIDITWCRFARQGWYESGCRLLKPATPPQITHTAV